MGQKFLKCLLFSVTLSLATGLVSAQINPCNRISLGQGASLNRFIPFPSSSLWITNIANAPLDPNSDAIINFIGSTTPLHADFGSGLYQGQSIGIPYICLLYTSDAADEEDSVDLGGRR